MTETIRIRKLNDVHLKVECESSMSYEIGEHFTFNVPGAKFSPAYKNKMWDGKIRLFHLMRGTLYMGLLSQLVRFAAERGYNVEYDNPSDFGQEVFSEDSALAFIKTLDLPHNVRDYQLSSFINAIRRKRALFVSPTASGKSLIIFMIAAYFMQKKILVIVPTIGLVHQMASDFVSYGCPEDLIYKIYGGQSKDTSAFITVTTWQSIYQQPSTWFKEYGVVVGDEAHQFKAKSLVDIMEKMTSCQYRFGFTGTLDGTQTNKLVLEGLFGPAEQVTTTAELMSSNKIAQLNIKAIVLSHDEETRRLFANIKNKILYKDEVNFIVQSKARNLFLINLVSSLKSNTLLLFNYVEHGKMLFKAIKEISPNRQVFLVYGMVEGEEREAVRQYAEKNTNVIIVASYKTFSTGVNIPSLENVVFGSPSKSRVRVLQSIGRALRLNDQKINAKLYDIADDISWKNHKNVTIKHFSERIQMYNQEKFNYNIYTINLKRNI